MSIVDARGRSFATARPARRIVSLVPSLTELLSDLGLDEEVVGLTRFCVRPSGWKRRKTIVGGTKNASAEKILALQPDLVIANREENERALVERLDAHVPVFLSEVVTLDDALGTIRSLGTLCGRGDEARALAEEIREGFETMDPLPPLRTVYLIWREPWMAAGGDTFIHSMLAWAGLVNAVGGERRYPQLDDDELREFDPQLVLLSSEPYPFGETHVAELRTRLPNARVRLVDGEAFSWYGSRLRHTPAVVQELRGRL